MPRTSKLTRRETAERTFARCGAVESRRRASVPGCGAVFNGTLNTPAAPESRGNSSRGFAEPGVLGLNESGREPCQDR